MIPYAKLPDWQLKLLVNEGDMEAWREKNRRESPASVPIPAPAALEPMDIPEGYTPPESVSVQPSSGIPGVTRAMTESESASYQNTLNNVGRGLSVVQGGAENSIPGLIKWIPLIIAGGVLAVYFAFRKKR